MKPDKQNLQEGILSQLQKRFSSTSSHRCPSASEKSFAWNADCFRERNFADKRKFSGHCGEVFCFPRDTSSLSKFYLSATIVVPHPILKFLEKLSNDPTNTTLLRNKSSPLHHFSEINNRTASCIPSTTFGGRTQRTRHGRNKQKLKVKNN